MRELAKLILIAIFVSPPAFGKFNIFACEPEWKALAELIGGEHVEAFSATTAFQDPHHIEARPSLIAKTRRADMVFCTGAELEIGWLPLLLRMSGNSVVQVRSPGYFMAAEQVNLLDILTNVDRSMGDVHAAGNPHVHLDPYRLLIIAKKLTRRLKLLDAEHAQYYQERYDDFGRKWRAAIEKWESDASALRGVKVVVQHKNWRYLFDWLGIEAIADLEPKPGLPPSTGHLVNVLDVLKGEPVQLIVLAAYQNTKAANWLAERKKLPVLILPFTVGGHERAMDLFALYELTILQLFESFSAGKAGP